MISLLDDARNLLERAGYATHTTRLDAPELHLEDECLLGFVRVFESVEEIVVSWRTAQESFLKQHAPSLLQAPVKAWNLYAIFLTRASTSSDAARALFAIEEDFQSARKIARGGIRTREELATVLGPLLPLQSRVSLVQADVHARLLDRLGPIGSPRRLLLSGATPQDIARLLSEDR